MDFAWLDWHDTLRLLLAYALALPVGWYREKEGHSIGVRTFPLTAVASCGYVLLAFLRSDLVERWHWLSEAQLLDAVAVGQITPGPLFTTATFVGYVLGGWKAAVLATLGIFLPAFVFVAISGPLIPRLRSSARAGAFLDGVVVASLALMAVVTWHLGRAALLDAPTVALAVVSLALLVRWRVSSAWLVLGGAGLGLAASWLGWVR